MNQKNSNMQRLCTLLISFAIVLTLCPSITRAAAPADRLPPLVSETSTQFQLAYRLHPVEQQQRQEQLAAVVAAWRAAPRNDANKELLTVWLRSAIRASMPGSHETLPPVPAFTTGREMESRVAEPAPIVAPVNEPTPAITPVAAPTPTVDLPATPEHQAAVDPFADDPADKQE